MARLGIAVCDSAFVWGRIVARSHIDCTLACFGILLEGSLAVLMGTFQTQAVCHILAGIAGAVGAAAGVVAVAVAVVVAVDS